jgi:peptidyl-prolyl cis-trans isomerase D
MLEKIQKRGQAVRILLGVVISIIALSMLITMLPGSFSSPSASPDVVVVVGGMPITATEIRREIQRASAGRQIPAALEPLYARQYLDQMLSEKMLEVEAARLGMQVTPQEQADRIRLLSPAAKAGDMQQYTAEVQQRFQMGVPEFEEKVRQAMLMEKFAQLVTDGVSVSQEEIADEFKRRNEKVTIEYALVQPDDWESKVTVADADLLAQYEKSKATYQVGEKRTIRYGLLDADVARRRVAVSQEELRRWYDDNLEQYRSEDRARVSHILFKTVGKTDAEVEEIRKKAEEVVKQARGKAKFEDLAKQHSEDTTKDKGGDLGWILRGQTVADFEKAAFALPLKTVSDPVKTEYGFHIIRVAERESARTQPFEEVRSGILPTLMAQKADRAVSDLADKISSTVRQNPRMTLEDAAQQFSLTLGEAGPAAVRESWGPLGLSTELDDAVFRLRPGELSAAIQVPQGYVLLSLKKVEAAHQGTLEEVRDRVSADVRKEKAAALAKSKAEEIAAKARTASLAAAAKAAGVATKTSEAFARTGSVSEVGSARQVAAAFTMKVGEVSPAVSLGTNWVVYRLASQEPIKADQLLQQMKEVEQSLMQSKRQLAFESFRDALRQRLTAEGKIKYNEENLRRLTGGTGKL